MLNPCELQIDLFCRGLRVPDDVVVEDGRGMRRTRAGLGSGLELVIPTGSWLKREIWMNAPVLEPFVQASPYVLEGETSAFQVRDERGNFRYRVRIPPRPVWYGWETAHATPMAQVGFASGLPPATAPRAAACGHPAWIRGGRS